MNLSVARLRALSAIVLTLVLLHANLPGIAQSSEVLRETAKFERFLDILDDKYLEEVDHHMVVEDAIRNVLQELDPHSVYYSAEELKKANEPLVGNFEGVGLQFNILHDTIVVVATISGGPSEKVGLMSGDKIIEVDGEVVAGMGINNQGVMDRLRGEKGTKVDVGIARRGYDELLYFNITRDKIPLYSLDAGYMADPETGYIKINRFSSTTVREFRQALAELEEEGMENLILDLRGNGGGYLNAATQLSNEFLNGKKLIVYTEGRAYPRQEVYSNFAGGFTEGKLVILINEGSASASEIVSGAVQDWDRGLIIGRRSFGKGLVQRPFSMPDGSAVRLTVSKYYTPSGRCIQKPYDEGVEAYREDLVKRLESGELMDKKAVEFPDSLKYYTNNDRIVFGGGGIMPDIFIPLDTGFVSDYYNEVLGKGVINQYAITYVNNHREELEKDYPDIESFLEDFEWDESYWESFFKYAEEEGVEKDEEDLELSAERIALLLRANFARNLYDIEAFFRVINQNDPSVAKALAVMKDETFEQLKVASK